MFKAGKYWQCTPHERHRKITKVRTLCSGLLKQPAVSFKYCMARTAQIKINLKKCFRVFPFFTHCYHIHEPYIFTTSSYVGSAFADKAVLSVMCLYEGPGKKFRQQVQISQMFYQNYFYCKPSNISPLLKHFCNLFTR